MIEFFEDGKTELYNLKSDIAEKKDLSLENPEMHRQLKKILMDWREDLNAPVPSESNPEFDSLEYNLLVSKFSQ